jgi:phospholipase C
VPHHEPFQYYASTANPHHLAPASLADVGIDTASPGKFDRANHQYDMTTFDEVVAGIRRHALPASALPAVSFLKAPAYQDGHPGYSDPLDEQRFIVTEINALERLPTWSSTAVILAYDDSDGWYDHVYGGVTNPSRTVADRLTGAGRCGTGTDALGGQQGRCGFGPRLPLLVVSPFAKVNAVSHTRTDQSSVAKFIVRNWSLEQIPASFANEAGSIEDLFDFGGDHRAPRLLLSPATGQTATR